MSYIERATYDFFKRSMTDGIRVLFSSKFIVFSILLTITTIATASFSFAYGTGQNLLGITVDLNLVRLLIFVEVSLSLVFILVGLLNRIIHNTFLKTIVVLVLWILLSSFGYLSIESANLDLVNGLSNVLTVGSLLIWALVIPITSLWASSGLFYSKITGSILFLGKPEDNHKAIFSGLMALLAFGGLVISYYLYTLKFIPLSLVLSVFSLIVIILVRGWLVKNDAFNSMVGFYYIMLIPTMFLLIYSELNGQSNDVVNAISYIVITFSLLYSAQGIVKKFREDKMERYSREMLSEKEDISVQDPFFLGRFVSFIGREGVVLIILGSLLGYHALQIQLYTAEFSSIDNNLFGSLFGVRTVSQVSHQLRLGIATILIVLLISSYLLFPHVRKAYSTEGRIYRFGFLPDYDSLVNFFEKYKGGEISWTDMLKKAAVMGTKKSSGAAASGIKSIFGKTSSIIKNRFKDSEDQ